MTISSPMTNAQRTIFSLSLPVTSPPLLHPGSHLCPHLTFKERDVNRLFSRQKLRKALGPDLVSPSTLKHCCDQLALIFTNIFMINGNSSASKHLASFQSPKNKHHWTRRLQASSLTKKVNKYKQKTLKSLTNKSI